VRTKLERLQLQLLTTFAASNMDARDPSKKPLGRPKGTKNRPGHKAGRPNNKRGGNKPPKKPGEYTAQTARNVWPLIYSHLQILPLRRLQMRHRTRSRRLHTAVRRRLFHQHCRSPFLSALDQTAGTISTNAVTESAANHSTTLHLHQRKLTFSSVGRLEVATASVVTDPSKLN
jgi:hypothetical protein